MTLKEKIKEIRPTSICRLSPGGVLGCPCHYEELNTNDGDECPDELLSCTECWNREYKED